MPRIWLMQRIRIVVVRHLLSGGGLGPMQVARQWWFCEPIIAVAGLNQSLKSLISKRFGFARENQTHVCPALGEEPPSFTIGIL